MAKETTSIPKNSFRLWYEKSKDPVDYWIDLLGFEDEKDKIGKNGKNGKSGKSGKNKGEESSFLSTYYR